MSPQEESTALKVEWKSATVKFAGEYASKPDVMVEIEKPGMIAVDTGLGYWIGIAEEPGDVAFASLTHIPSGLRICGWEVYSGEVARRMIEAVIPLLNWNRPLEELTADPEYQATGKKMFAIWNKFYCENPEAFDLDDEDAF